MDNYDQLMIRACKRFHGARLLKRLRKIYARRIAISEEGVHNHCLFIWMVSVAHGFQRKVNPVDLVMNAHPSNGWMFSCDDGDYWERFVAVIASHIRLMEVAYIPDYKPMKLRWDR